METKVTSPGIKALMIALLMIVVFMGIYLAGVPSDSPVQYITSIILLAGVIISISMYGKQLHYNATFGKYFAHGFKVTAIVTIIMIVYLVVFLMVFPEYKDKMITESEKKMREDSKITEDQISQGISMMRKMFLVFLIGGTLLFNLLIGAIASLIGAATTKKDKQNYQQDINKIGT